MAVSVDSLISEASRRASFFSSEAEGAAGKAIRYAQELSDRDYGLLVDTGSISSWTDVPIDTISVSPMDISGEPVPLPFGSITQMGDVGTVSSTGMPVNTAVAPSIQAFPAPSTEAPAFESSMNPGGLDTLVAQINAVAAPYLADIQFPEINDLALPTRPDLIIPTYDAPAFPEPMDTPIDFANSLLDTYRTMVPEMQAFVDDKVATWVATYAPEYQSWVTTLSGKVISGMSGAVLPDQIETEMFNRARSRVEREFDAVEQTTLDQFAKSGFIEPPGTVTSAILTARLKNAAALADQASDIYVHRRETEIKHLEFVMGLASQQITTLRQAAIAYVQAIGQTLQTSVQLATAVLDAHTKFYDVLIKRSELMISIVDAVGRAYEARLKASLAALDGYRLELEGEKLKVDVESAKLAVVEARVKAQQLQVERYSAMVDAVAKRAVVEEIKLKYYQTEASVFDSKVKGMLAGVEAYKAGIEGNKADVERYAAEVGAYEAEVRAKTAVIDAEVKAMTGNIEVRKGMLEADRTRIEAIGRQSELALKGWIAGLEGKKARLDGETTVNKGRIDVAVAKSNAQMAMIEGQVKKFTTEVQAKVEALRVQVEATKVAMGGFDAAANAFGTMGGAALGSLNSMVSATMSA